jgi:predicted phosphodiesterase
MAILGDITKEYLKKYPSAGSFNIAKIMVDENKTIFESIEHARHLVRYYRGANGVKDRLKMNEKSYMARIDIAPADETDFTPYKLSENDFPIIVGADVHIPYYDQDAIEIFIERIDEMKPKTIILAGDWIDFYSISRYQHDPRKRTVKSELELFNDILDAIQKVSSKAKIIFKYGNHEERYDNYLMQKAPELFAIDSIQLENILNLKSRSIDIVKDKRVIKISHLNLIHGHEYVFSISNPVNPARGLFNRAKKTSMCFHFHQTSEHTEPTISGEIITCWSVGCLCNLHPEYMPLNKWNHGFAEIYNEDGFFNVKNRKIINYKLL